MATFRTSMIPFGGVVTFDANRDAMSPFGGVLSEQLIAASVSAALTGTVTASITEADIVTGGKTIILTLTGDTWVAVGATFDAQRQAIIDGLNGV